METRHRVIGGDARDLADIEDNAVELVVTSPPYPMIELWDELFATLDPAIADHLAAGDGSLAFAGMHDILDEAWEEVARVLINGGIACINIGDATRRLDGGFRRYSNHARITATFEALGFDPLPTIHWHKPTNAATKFMGSGMLPPNAYVTQEHEHILIFRKGGALREFEPKAPDRYQAAYFWEERNRWFSDRWTDVRGRSQALDAASGRDRSAAFPLTIPYRLIAMYSVYGDTILDPFWGTGTTTIAAMAAARNSIGVEIDDALRDQFAKQVDAAPEIAREMGQMRIDRHREFLDESAADAFEYQASALDMPVKTRQEADIQFYGIASMGHSNDGYVVSHQPIAAARTESDVE